MDSPSQPLLAKRIAYFDTAGKQVESYRQGPEGEIAGPL
jgi:hypothetical protein